MKRMGFTHHPGALPFVTIRRQQWANRLTVGENIEIHGEHGCDMPPIAAKVEHIGTVGDGSVTFKVPAHIERIYGAQPLCAISLVATDDKWVKVGESWHKVLDADKKQQP